MSPRSGAGGCPAGSCFTSRALQVTTNHRLPRYHVHLSSDRDLDNIHSTLFVFLNVFMSAGRPQAAFLGIVMPLPRSDPVTGNTVIVTTRVLEWVWGFLGTIASHSTFRGQCPVREQQRVLWRGGCGAQYSAHRSVGVRHRRRTDVCVLQRLVAIADM